MCGEREGNLGKESDSYLSVLWGSALLRRTSSPDEVYPREGRGGAQGFISMIVQVLSHESHMLSTRHCDELKGGLSDDRKAPKSKS